MSRPRTSDQHAHVAAALAFVLVAALACKSKRRHEDEPSSTTATTAVTTSTSEDQAATLIAQCGKPDRDTVKVEGGQQIRHVVYKKKDLELLYLLNANGKPSQLVGIFPANDDPMAQGIASKDANKRLPCADGGIFKAGER